MSSKQRGTKVHTHKVVTIFVLKTNHLIKIKYSLQETKMVKYLRLTHKTYQQDLRTRKDILKSKETMDKSKIIQNLLF